MKKKTPSSGGGRVWLPAAIKLLALALPLVLLVAGVNYAVDPARLFHYDRASSPEYRAAALMRQGSGVENLGEYDDRLLRRITVENLTQAPGTLVLGSSRGAMVSSKMLGRDDLLNLSVTGGVLSDAVGLYGLLYAKHLLPGRLVLVVDFWMLNDHYVETRSAPALGDAYYRFATERLCRSLPESLLDINPRYSAEESGDVGFFDLSRETRAELFSVPYFQVSVQRLVRTLRSPQSALPQATAQELGDTSLLVRADGSVSYPASFREADPAYAESAARMTVANKAAGLDDFDSAGRENYTLLTDFIRAAREDGVAVTVLVQPLSPVVYDFLASDARYAPIFGMESDLKAACGALGAAFFGSSDPAAAGLTMADFSDGLHLREGVLAALLEPLRGLPDPA